MSTELYDFTSRVLKSERRGKSEECGGDIIGQIIFCLISFKYYLSLRKPFDSWDVKYNIGSRLY
jgi:hypothetical protein